MRRHFVPTLTLEGDFECLVLADCSLTPGRSKGPAAAVRRTPKQTFKVLSSAIRPGYKPACQEGQSGRHAKALGKGDCVRVPPPAQETAVQTGPVSRQEKKGPKRRDKRGATGNSCCSDKEKSRPRHALSEPPKYEGSNWNQQGSERENSKQEEILHRHASHILESVETRFKASYWPTTVARLRSEKRLFDPLRPLKGPCDPSRAFCIRDGVGKRWEDCGRVCGICTW
jgi:hypothetical protein